MSNSYDSFKEAQAIVTMQICQLRAEEIIHKKEELVLAINDLRRDLNSIKGKLNRRVTRALQLNPYSREYILLVQEIRQIHEEKQNKENDLMIRVKGLKLLLEELEQVQTLYKLSDEYIKTHPPPPFAPSEFDLIL